MENNNDCAVGGVAGYADTNAYIYRAYYLCNKNQKLQFNSDINGVGDNTNAATATAVNLDQSKMQQQSNYMDWDYNSIWQVVKGVNNGYPIFIGNTKALRLPKALASVKAGMYKKPVTIKLSCVTPDSNIYYTTDGTKPTENSMPYQEAFMIKKTSTVKVLVVRDGFKSSQVASFKYVINKR
jgi:hypothetical protein